MQTPAYIYDALELAASVERLRSVLPTGSRVFYSPKANPQQVIIGELAKLGVGAEVASEGERLACKTAGVRDDALLIAGVAKSLKQLQNAVEHGCGAIVIDSRAEWRRLSALPLEGRVCLLLRINPGVALGGWDMGGASQFGLEVEDALSLAREIGSSTKFRFLGLHAYLGSQRLMVPPIVKTVRLMAEATEQFKSAAMPPSVVDVGLGCGVPYRERDKVLSWSELRESLQVEWSLPVWREVEVWSEAGRSLVASCGYFVTRVVERKVLNGKTFVFLDGGLNVHNPGVGLGRTFRSNPRLQFHTRNERAMEETVNLVGNLCTSVDRLAGDVVAPALDTGDFVLVPCAGAYCHTTGMWGFNSQPLFAEYVLTKTGDLQELQPQHQVNL